MAILQELQGFHLTARVANFAFVGIVAPALASSVAMARGMGQVTEKRRWSLFVVIWFRVAE